mmetsp:Transcript_26917/g.77282  ORF Transcript_26917/g.77282 Transcript_26917/m.77282 type:complete len:89 (-) Transcript_26917:238-504(-)
MTHTGGLTPRCAEGPIALQDPQTPTPRHTQHSTLTPDAHLLGSKAQIHSHPSIRYDNPSHHTPRTQTDTHTGTHPSIQPANQPFIQPA